MLDYKKLSDDFTNKLNQFDEEKLTQWLSFDQQRQEIDKLINGEQVLIHFENISVSKISDPLELINLAGESNYALAA